MSRLDARLKSLEARAGSRVPPISIAEADALMEAVELEVQTTGQIRATFLPACPLSRERQAQVIAVGLRIPPSAVIWDN